MAKARVTRKFNSAQTSRPELAARYIFFVKQAITARRSLRLGHPCVFNVTFGSPNVRCAFGSHPCSVDYCSAVKRTPPRPNTGASARSTSSGSSVTLITAPKSGIGADYRNALPFGRRMVVSNLIPTQYLGLRRTSDQRSHRSG